MDNYIAQYLQNNNHKLAINIFKLEKAIKEDLKDDLKNMSNSGGSSSFLIEYLSKYFLKLNLEK